MKSTLATILGTAALGLMKIQGGSSLRLKIKKIQIVILTFQMEVPFVYVSRGMNDRFDREFFEYFVHRIPSNEYPHSDIRVESVDIKPAKENIKIAIIKSRLMLELNPETTMNEVTDLLRKEIDLFLSHFDKEFPIEKRRKKLKIDETYEPRPGYTTSQFTKEYSGNSSLSAIKREMDGQFGLRRYAYEKSNRPYFVFGIERLESPEDKVINADTGKLYKPNTKASKLRKR